MSILVTQSLRAQGPPLEDSTFAWWPEQMDPPPVVADWPARPWGDSLRSVKNPSVVLLQALIRRDGRVAPGSIIRRSTTRGKNLYPLAERLLYNARFLPGQREGRAVNAFVEMSIDLADGRLEMPSRVSEDFIYPYNPAVERPPELVFSPPPDYPERLRQAGIAGRVVAQAIIDRSGKVQRGSVRIVSSPHPDFEASVIEYLRHARFNPGLVGGKPVRTVVHLPVNFSIRQR